MNSSVLNFIRPLCVAALAVFVMFGLVTVESEAHFAVYKLGIKDPTVFIGDPIKVVWLAPYHRATDDLRIAVYKEGSRSEIQEVKIAPRAEFGYENFYLTKEGRYEVRMYIDGDDKKVVARHTGILVAEDNGESSFSSSYRLEVEDESVIVGEPVYLNWRVPTQERKYSFWIGFYEDEDDEDTDYAFWTDLDTNDKTTGTAIFIAKKVGTYDEIRMFRGSRGYDLVEVSDDELKIRNGTPGTSFDGFEVSFDDSSVDVREEFEVSFERPDGRTSSKDWIGIYQKGASDRSYEEWKYVGRDPSGEVVFELDEPGTYEARLFLDNGYERVAESDDTISVR